MDVHNVFILSQDLPWVPQLAATLMQVFPSWRKELEDFPVLTWKQFLYRTQEQINPLVSDERLRIVTSALNDIGDVSFFSIFLCKIA